MAEIPPIHSPISTLVVSTPTLAIVATRVPLQALAMTHATEETPLSLAACMRKMTIDQTVEHFKHFLETSVRMMLDEGYPFDSWNPVLQMYVDNLTRLVGANAASTYQAHLWLMEKDISELLTFSSGGTNIFDLASKRVWLALKERERFLEVTLAKESQLKDEVC
ncbi:uncharacterized protein A4U43_C02F12430 [Asparagus officinalis]|uniref:Uncharacterized protein n=1 Tax=Asparagus officinalis TaxID=4686 RepID=A0A5P1FMM2_ASPOF|nr:uncharacterized protein A4U43_C02F12430 [Asparagus officinalis]